MAWFLLEVPLIAWSGLTVGKHLLGLRVVRLDNGSQRVGLPRATARWLLRIVNGATSLSLFDGVGAGTLVVAEGEFRRLLGMTPDEDRRAGHGDRRGDRGRTGDVSARAAWISTLLVTVVIIAFFVTL